VVTIVGVTITGLIAGLQSINWLQPLELRAFDWMVRQRLEPNPDPRLLIVGITEEDIRIQQRSTPSDATLAQVIDILEQANPRAIGVDLYRDVPQEPGHEELLEQLQSPNVVVITNLGNSEADGVRPPNGVTPEQIGFNDVLVDPDGVVRRNLLFGSNESGVYFSFSLRLALLYLQAENILPQASSVDSNYLQLGAATFLPLNPYDGGYQQIDSAGYQILLNYHSQHDLARHVTLSDVLNHRVDPSWIQDKIVLIGTIAPSGKDLFQTPYSAGEEIDHLMPGVEVHAQMVSQLLSTALDQQPLFWFFPGWTEIVWIALWAYLGGLLAWYVRHPITLALAEVVSIGLLTGGCFVILTYYGWVPVVAPLLALTGAAGSVVAYRAHESQRQQQMVMTLLGQNTSPEIAEALWSNRDRLLQSGKIPGQRLTATILFIDIRDFSTVSERIDPEMLLNWLNEYLEGMTQIVQHYQGIVNKFTGDGLMAVFGVPVPRESLEAVAEDAVRAISCALEMGDRLDQLVADWATRDLPIPQMRVGIFTGPVIVGSLGGKDRLEYGVIGDSVNIASRLESCAKDRQDNTCRVLVAFDAPDVLEHIMPRFHLEAWGPMLLKGKRKAVEVYQVIRPSTVCELVPNTSTREQTEKNLSHRTETTDSILNL
jgi:CHASE2 domain-containing sensor protein/class 3 adenylate cyclase